ncbi:hypothetical protein F4V73_18115 [Morganella psychrotolerans]|uniref:Uncharacterized protein n=1 Tax=Morganella psychrotolerans TaxID=368603 RepID=A0A5M9QX76_9GAMM|nr:hypothetical protein F4V73_18115 [Morganella psychrotolerans]
MSFAATGCVNSSPATDPLFCETASPIYISADDSFTDLTARQILTHNLTGHRLCGWMKSGK